ncbi:FadR/GntR family transcriptional regulator [Asticcacaulis sp. SL142]|nr:FadR/GntR family transcriptional regulator [Asticcacaulis sp. SL142]
MHENSPQPDRLYRRVADKMIAAIQEGEYVPGCKLPAERDLAETLGVSRPTIREAMIALEIMGVVEIRDRSGIYVLNGDNRAIVETSTPAVVDLSVGAFELLEARIFVEGAAAGLAAETATPDDIDFLKQCLAEMMDSDPLVRELADRSFHMRIAAMSNNSALAAAVELMWDLRRNSPLASQIMTRALGGGATARINEHESILNALAAHDAMAAREAMRMHLEQVRDYVLDATETAEIDALRSKLHQQRQRVLHRTQKMGA